MKCECGNDTFYSSQIKNEDYWICRKCNKSIKKNIKQEEREIKKDYFNNKKENKE